MSKNFSSSAGRLFSSGIWSRALSFATASSVCIASSCSSMSRVCERFSFTKRLSSSSLRDVPALLVRDLELVEAARVLQLHHLLVHELGDEEAALALGHRRALDDVHAVEVLLELVQVRAHVAQEDHLRVAHLRRDAVLEELEVPAGRRRRSAPRTRPGRPSRGPPARPGRWPSPRGSPWTSTASLSSTLMICRRCAFCASMVALSSSFDSFEYTGSSLLPSKAR